MSHKPTDVPAVPDVEYRMRRQKSAPGVTAFKPSLVPEPVLLTGKRHARALIHVGYEASVPRCGTCSHFRGWQTKLFNSLPVFFPARCVLHRVRVKPVGCCDFWISQNGDTLDAD